MIITLEPGDFVIEKYDSSLMVAEDHDPPFHSYQLTSFYLVLTPPSEESEECEAYGVETEIVADQGTSIMHGYFTLPSGVFEAYYENDTSVYVTEKPNFYSLFKVYRNQKLFLYAK